MNVVVVEKPSGRSRPSSFTRKLMTGRKATSVTSAGRVSLRGRRSSCTGRPTEGCSRWMVGSLRAGTHLSNLGRRRSPRASASVGSVAGPLSGCRPFCSTRRFTAGRRRTGAENVRKVSLRNRCYSGIKSVTGGSRHLTARRPRARVRRCGGHAVPRILTNAGGAGGPSVGFRPFFSIRGSMGRRKPSGVTGAPRPFAVSRPLFSTYGLTAGRRCTSAGSATRSATATPPLCST